MKFVNLLKKELSELINAQMLVGLAAIMMIFMFLGNTMSDAIEEEVKAMTKQYTDITISDRDNSDFTKDMIASFEEAGVKVTNLSTSGEDYAKILADNDTEFLTIIPEGFGEAVQNGKKPQLVTVSRMKSAATMSNISNDNDGPVAMISQYISDSISDEVGLTEDDVARMASPVEIVENTVVDNNSANVSISSLTSKIMIQNMILPIIVFVLIILTSQMLITAISNEKIDKTLETLLSAPVSRGSVIGAKMLSAAIVALINAVVYMIGFSSFISGSTKEATQEITNSVAGQYLSVDDAMAKLGLTLGAVDYVLVGLQLFFTILICLSISLILGALVNDTKSSQFVLMPIMILAMVPYMISMFKDINSLPMGMRIFVYAIPFTHTFSSMSNLMFGNRLLFFAGLAYQIVFFAVCMFFALKLFKSDKLFTISLNLSSKSKFRKGKKGAPAQDE